MDFKTDLRQSTVGSQGKFMICIECTVYSVYIYIFFFASCTLNQWAWNHYVINSALSVGHVCEQLVKSHRLLCCFISKKHPAKNCSGH